MTFWLILTLIVFAAAILVASSACKNTRSLQRSQARLALGRRVVDDIERQGRRHLLRNLAIALGFFGLLLLLGALTH